VLVSQLVKVENHAVPFLFDNMPTTAIRPPGRGRLSAGPRREGVALAARKKTEEQVVRVAQPGELRGYTISEHELDKLEQGGPISDLLTIGRCLLTVDVTVLTTPLSTSFPDLTFVLFFCALLLLCRPFGIEPDRCRGIINSLNGFTPSTT
jgi:hypothetical protein